MARALSALIALLLAALAGPVAAQTPDEQRQLDWVQQRGRLLYEIDRAAWVTTDDLRARLPDLATAGIRGWTVERDGAAYVVSYYAGEGEARAVLYRGRVENNRVVAGELLAARPLLTPAQRRLADARSVVARMGRAPCTRSPFNVAVIPPAAPDGPIDVYALTAQTENGVYPFGGHFRATVAASGEILSQRAFTNSCLNMGPPPRRGGRGMPAALAVSHLLDPTPTEVHVFLSIWAGIPVFVGTGNPPRIWEVAGDRIHLVQASN